MADGEGLRAYGLTIAPQRGGSAVSLGNGRAGLWLRKACPSSSPHGSFEALLVSLERAALSYPFSRRKDAPPRNLLI
jgi:hypothetical protein